MKKLSIWIAVTVLVAVMVSLVQAAQTDGIAAVVNNEIITLYELNEAFAPIQKKIDANYKGDNKAKLVSDTKEALLNRMIEGSLIEQETKKSGIVIKDEEVAEAINNILANRQITKDELAKLLEKDGMTLEAYTKDMKMQIGRMKLVRREINAKVSVADDEIGAYYSAHRDLFEGKEAVRIWQILLSFPTGAGAQGKADLKAEAEAVVKQLKSGERFEVLASKYAGGSAAAAGGDLGFIERGLILPEVEEVAFQLPLEEISPVIESSVGFHIIKITDKRGAGVKSMESVRHEIREKILEEKAEKRYGGWIQELRKKSHIEIRI
ncbi:MAG: peptidylprolyl isomerase [Deltaproteobacteria bacterium]|nr:peptidylprolyl isomerase [Deltaproteobacteria bacterium]